MHLYVGAFANVLVIGALISVLKPPPSADVVHENDTIVSSSSLDVLKEFPKATSPREIQSAFPRVGVRANNRHTVCLGVAQDCLALIFSGILLMLGGHADILGGGGETRWGY